MSEAVAEKRYLTASDKILWDLDRDPRFRASIASLLLFDRAPDWDRFVDKMERITRAQAYFRRRLVETPFGLAPPRWAYVDDFDLNYHLRRVAVPEGEGLRHVLDLSATWACSTYDKSRPLWSYTLFEGLPEGKAALLQLAHHAVTDGMGGVELSQQFYDPERHMPDLGPLPPEPEGEDPAALELVRDAAVHSTRQAARLVGQATSLAGNLAARVIRDPARFGRDAAAYTSSAVRMLTPVTEAASPIMKGRGIGRRYDIFEVPLAELHDAAATRGASVNDGFLTAVGGGLGRYHERCGAQTEMLRITTTISIRRPDDPEGGNRVNGVRYEIPVGVGNVEDRLDATREIGHIVREEPAVDISRYVAIALGQLPSALMVPVYGAFLVNMDALATNVPGMPAKAYVSGARVDAWHVFGPTEGSALGVALISHAGQCCIGITSDTAAVADPDLLVECLKEGFDEVVALAG